MHRLFAHREHLVRMAGLFVVGIFAFVIARALFVPKDFGAFGHYRPGALADNRAYAPVFAGRAACVECHSDVPVAQKGSKHAMVGCEACHGALALHAGSPSDNPPAKLEPKKLCATCHTANVAKPKGFPQVDPKSHGDGNPCTGCHDAHSPQKEPQKK